MDAKNLPPSEPLSNMQQLVSHWNTIIAPTIRKKRGRDNDEITRPQNRVFESVMSSVPEQRKILKVPATSRKA
jgi:hypothetical protein